MRVLALLPPPSWGGLHAHFALTATAFAQRGFGKIIACIPIGPEFDLIADRLVDLKLEVLRCHMSRLRSSLRASCKFLLNFRKEVLELSRLISLHKIDIVQTPGAHHFHGLFAAKRAAIPLVWQFHSDFAPMPLRWLASHLAANFASAIMFNGENIRRRFFVPTSANVKCFSFGPVVDLLAIDKGNFSRLKVRGRLGIKEDDILLGTVGVRTAQKNHRMFVEVGIAAHRLNPQIKIVVIGAKAKGSEERYQIDVVDFASKLPAPSRSAVQFVEPDSPIPDYLAAMDVFLLTSVAEGMPIAVAEALGAGLPVISTKVGGVSEMTDVFPFKSIYLMSEGDEMASMLNKISRDSDLRATAKVIARESVEKRFTPEVSAGVHFDAYQFAMNKS